jgi:hypothetical protein
MDSMRLAFELVAVREASLDPRDRRDTPALGGGISEREARVKFSARLDPLRAVAGPHVTLT